MLLHENHAGRRHEKNHCASDNAGNQVGPENNFVKQFHTKAGLWGFLRAESLQLLFQQVLQEIFFIAQRILPLRNGP